MRALVLLCVVPLLGACEKKDAPPSGGEPAAAASAAPSASAAKPEEPPAPWYVGSWSGTYDAQHYLIEMERKQGGIRDWAQDEGGVATGAGKLTLNVDEDGRVTGSGSGALGEQIASGNVEDEELRVKLTPKEPGEQAFLATLVVKRAGEALDGRLQASSGDSRTVRDSAVKLTRSEGAAKPAE